MDLAPYGEAIAKGADLLNGVIRRVLPEKMSEKEAADLKQALTLAMLDGENQKVLAQLAINKAEAQSGSLFIAGWRPFVGWVCGASFAYAFIAQPLAAFVITAMKWAYPPLPGLDLGPLLTVLGGLLGLGGLRTYEKLKGVEGSR